MKSRADFSRLKRCVIKIGSALLTSADQGLDTGAMQNWVAQIARLRAAGIDVVLVSSGSIAEGMQRLGWRQRPRALHQLQAAAAVGQMGLVRSWESAFRQHGLHTAQILLTHDDLANRQRYLNARSTLRSLLELGVVPVVNENDTVSTEEIALGDNDTLAAMVSNLVEAELLIILTDQDGVFDKDPRTNGDAVLIAEADAGDESLLENAGDSGELGRGGMRSKVIAAQKAAQSGAVTVIAPGRQAQVIEKVIGGKPVGTVLWARDGRIAARKQWLASHRQARGTLELDDGAVKVLRESGKSLLAVGVSGVQGEFSRGDLVRCINQSGEEVARGLTNYNSQETRKIMGQPSRRIEELLGYVDEKELIHRDNLVLE
ncbi:MAG: glutamate 5-kinase [Gammaproteobacteria bacterium]|nr:MAG: glutamate 5-kinase [Gammaproteobacteria bacterium]RTZ60373.1 MAG: glutamate 5-kinase [Gammaproteobacteria bacterium]